MMKNEPMTAEEKKRGLYLLQKELPGAFLEPWCDQQSTV